MAAAKKAGVEANLTGDEPPTKQARAVLYAQNVLMSTDRLSPHARVIHRWVDESAVALGCETGDGIGMNQVADCNGDGDDDSEDAQWRPSRGTKYPSAAVWKTLQRQLGATATSRPVGWSAFDEPIAYLCQGMGFNPAEAAVLQLMLDYEEFKPVEELWDRMSQRDGLGGYLAIIGTHT